MDVTALASSGITGVIIASLYIFYKCFVKKKCNSKCCCGELQIETQHSVEEPVEPPKPTPKQTPTAKAEKTGDEIPDLSI